MPNVTANVKGNVNIVLPFTSKHRRWVIVVTEQSQPGMRDHKTDVKLIVLVLPRHGLGHNEN